MSNNNSKRKSSAHATSPPPSKRSPLHAFSPPRMSATSPPPPPPHYALQQQQQQSRPLTTAAAAVAAMKRGANASPQAPQTPYRRQSNSTAPPSRQGSVETDREGSVAASTQAEDEAASSAANKDDTATAGKEAQNKEDAEAEDDEKEDVVVDFNANMQAQMEKAKEDMKVLLENFSDDQLQRYEGYRRSALNRTNVKRLVSQVLNQQCSQTMAFVVAGFSKVYVGEIVEKAKEIMEEWGDNGAIRPEHLREAHRRYKRDKVSNASLGRRL